MAQSNPGFILKVFYLWDFGVSSRRDPGFGNEIVWDVPLLEGYEHEFVANTSRHPGTHHFWGLQNPALRTRVRQWAPDAALLIGFNHASLLHFILRAGNLPLLFRGDSHHLENPAPTPRAGLKHQLRRLIFAQFRAFLAVGTANRNYFLSHGIPERRIFISPHCVDNERFEQQATRAAGAKWRSDHQVMPDERVILFAGKFEPKKRPDLLLEAFASLAPRNTCLLFAGAGHLESHLRNRSRELGLNVRFAPFQNQSAMPAVYAAADALVLPSSGERETWGLSLNEAMASGIPVIVSSHVGGGPDLVIAGQTGWIFPADDCAALADCLSAVLADEDRRKKMGENARRHVREHFHYENATAGLRQALDAIQSDAC